MINKIIVQRFYAIRNTILIILLISIPYILIFGLETMATRFQNITAAIIGGVIIASLVYLMTIGGVKWGLAVNEKKGLRKINFYVNIWIVLSVFGGLFMLLGVFIQRQSESIIPLFLVVGVLYSSISIKKKYIIDKLK